MQEKGITTLTYAALLFVLRKLFKALLYIDDDMLSMLSTPYRFNTASNAMPVLVSSLLTALIFSVNSGFALFCGFSEYTISLFIDNNQACDFTVVII